MPAADPPADRFPRPTPRPGADDEYPTGRTALGRLRSLSEDRDDGRDPLSTPLVAPPPDLDPYLIEGDSLPDLPTRDLAHGRANDPFDDSAFDIPLEEDDSPSPQPEEAPPAWTGALADEADAEPNPLALGSVLVTCVGRLALLAALWGVCAAVVWLWWPQWRADFSRSEPWLAALSWWGEAATVAWATGAILMGRLAPTGPAGGAVSARDPVRRWAVAGVLVSLLLDFGISLGGYAVDYLASARTRGAVGWPVAAEGVAGPRGDGVDVRLTLRFVPTDPAGNPRLDAAGQPVMHRGTTTVRLPPPAAWPPGGPVGPDRLPRGVAVWAWNAVQPAALGGGPAWFPVPVGVRYDPRHPGRFWVAGQGWDRGAPSRLLLCILPLLQIGILLCTLRWRPWPTPPDPAGPDPLGRLLAAHLPAFPLASELLFLGGWGILEAGWVL